jgi:hypothetical protein
MASQTRVNPVAGSTNAGHTHASLFSVAQLKSFVITCGGGTTLASQGGIGGAIEAAFREIQPLMFISTGTGGVLHVVVDGHAVDAASLAARLVALGTVNGYNFASTTVTLGTAIVVS